jgi:hypothetical protein
MTWVVGAVLVALAAVVFTLVMAVRQLNDQVSDLETQIYVTDRTLCQRVEEARC